MNILHLKYAAAVAETGSLTKAAEQMLVAPPNMSRAIQTLEKDIGIKLFRRTAKGMALTPKGENFISDAREILDQLSETEGYYKSRSSEKVSFSVSVPRAGYISGAFSEFSNKLEVGSKLHYAETNSYGAIDNVLNCNFNLGIIRAPTEYRQHFTELLDKEKLVHKVITEFRYEVIANADSPIGKLDTVRYSDLEQLIEIAYADPYVPTVPISTVRYNERAVRGSRKIYVFDRSSSLFLMQENKNTYMWVSPTPQKHLTFYGLCQKKCPDNTRSYTDVLIYRQNYKLTETDKMFIAEVCRSAGECGF
ncbi:MAG: LysR family transcriptional regulator [Ruminiclostridium sp.]|nr:LysR family transcriptional regulator [Ruminiclostridium sp.]